MSFNFNDVVNEYEERGINFTFTTILILLCLAMWVFIPEYITFLAILWTVFAVVKQWNKNLNWWDILFEAAIGITTPLAAIYTSSYRWNK